MNYRHPEYKATVLPPHPASQFKPAYNVTSEFGMWSEEIAIQMSKLSHFELLNVGETRYRSYYGLKAS
jgi:hypothetical protein